MRYSNTLGTPILICFFGCLGGSCSPTHPHTDTISPPDIQEDSGRDAIDPPDGFDPHVVFSFDTEEDLLAYGSLDTPIQVKFVFTEFNDPDLREVSFLEYPFYTLHDQWYWFHLLNNVGIDGYPVEPVEGFSFETVEEVTAFFEGKTVLPLDLKFAGDRLYSPGFYADGFGDDRFFGLGSLLHFDANPDRVVPEELWLFELEYSDDLSESQVSIFFESLKPLLPGTVASSLRWLTRSPEQEALGNAIKEGDGPYANKIVRYSDLVVEGAFETYNPGITAGRVSIFEKGTLSQADLTIRDIVVLEEIPDYLPPVAGIITGVPQTPLSHLNLLAKSRGTPNIYIGGATENLQLNDYGYFKKYVVMEFTEEGFAWNTITFSQYNEYKALLADPVLTVETIDLTNAPYTLDLSVGGLDDIEETIPLTGGKSAQLMAFNDFPDIQIPDEPTAITIRGFAEHVAGLEESLEILFNDPIFEDDVSVRYLCLEGSNAFLMSQPDPIAGQAWISSLLNSIPSDSPVFTAIAQGGVRETLRKQPVDPAFQSLILDFLQEQYGHFDPSQGLRFRSSSTAEDIEGFNGAGLYESHTGFLFPEQQPNKDQHQSALWAILETWSSYYAFEAFEERRAAGIDHFSANMGLLVHARFDDDLEISNGVFTLALQETDEGKQTILTVNAQNEDISVTNPEPGSNALPEIDRVIQSISGDISVERIQASNQIPTGIWVLSDERLLEIHAQARVLAESWLAERNGSLPADKKESTLVLDFEYRHMDAGWPSITGTPPTPERFIWKQVRTLAPPLSLPNTVSDYPIPADLLAYTSSIDSVECAGETFEASLMAVFTNAEVSGPFDYATVPFLAKLDFRLKVPLEGVSLGIETQENWTHPDFLGVESTVNGDSGWSATIYLKEAEATRSGITAFSFTETGEWTLFLEEGEPISGEDGPCEFSPLVITPTEFLKTLLDPESPEE